VIRINLLPVEERQEREESKGIPGLLIAGGAVAVTALVVLLAVMLQARAIASLKEEQVRLEKLSDEYRPLIQRVNQLTQERKELETKMQVIDQLDQERDYRVRLLEELNSKTPRYAWLTKFNEMDGMNAEIEGSTFSNLVVADFIAGLERSDLYDQVDLTVAKKAEIGAVDVVEFKLTALLARTRNEPVEVSTRAGDTAGEPR
jgi:Tfp pilus assembly protein PilN